MIRQDDRTPEQMLTHTVIIGGTDRFMSGWGHARGGTSVAGWACRPEDAEAVYEWVEKRGDIQRVRRLGRNRDAAHVHVYVADETHPSLERLYAFRRECALSQERANLANGACS